MDVGNDFVKLVSIILGDIDISYDFRNVELHARLDKITVYPFGKIDFNIIEDNE